MDESGQLGAVKAIGESGLPRDLPTDANGEAGQLSEAKGSSSACLGRHQGRQSPYLLTLGGFENVGRPYKAFFWQEMLAFLDTYMRFQWV
jgi:hypothetical protein